MSHQENRYLNRIIYLFIIYLINLDLNKLNNFLITIIFGILSVNIIEI